MTTYRVEVKPPLPPEPPNDGAFWFDPKEDLGEVWYRAGDGWFRMGGKYRFGWSEVCEHTDPAKWVRLVKDPADEARELPAIRERVAAGEEMWLGLSRDEAELLLAEIDRTAAALAAVERDYQVVEEDCDSMMPVVEAVKAFLITPGADDDADALVAAVERVAAVEQDRDKLSAELTVVRRERAWLLADLSEAELAEFRLLAQTAERAREDAKKTGRAHRFEALLGDPNEQFDPRAELLASVTEYMNAPPAAASAQPKQPNGTEAYAAPLTDLIGIAPDGPAGRTRCPLCNTLPIGHEGDCEP